MWPLAWTAGALPSGRQRRSRTRIAGPPEVLGQPLGGGQDLRSGQATHRRYHTAVVVPSLPDPEKLAAVREAIPALAAGIYLNTGSVGPLPAETAAAMADMAAYERDVGRAHADYFAESLAPDGRGAGRRRGGARHRRRRGRADPRDDRRDERRDAAARLACRRPRGDDGPRARRRRPARCTRCATGIGVDVAFVDAGDDGDDERTLAAFEAAITPDTRLVVDLARPVDDRRGHAGRPDRGRWPTLAARWSSSTARRPPARSRSASTTSARTCTPSRPRSGCSGPEGMGALVVDPAARRAAHAGARRLVQLRARRTARGDAAWWPDARRFESTRLPPAVGRRDGPLDRLAVDVRRARLRPPARGRRMAAAAADPAGGDPRRRPS